MVGRILTAYLSADDRANFAISSGPRSAGAAPPIFMYPRLSSVYHGRAGAARSFNGSPNGFGMGITTRSRAPSLDVERAEMPNKVAAASSRSRFQTD